MVCYLNNSNIYTLNAFINDNYKVLIYFLQRDTDINTITWMIYL